MSIGKLLVALKVTCLLKEDFNITVCDGDCGSRLVATIDYDYRRMVSPGTCSCCEGDGEITTVIVKCFDVRKKDAYLGEHSITYMDYNRCFCTTCGRELIYHNDDGGDKDGSGGDDDDDDKEHDDGASDDDADDGGGGGSGGGGGDHDGGSDDDE